MKEVRGPVTYLFAAILLGVVNGLYGILALLDLPYVLRNEYPCMVGIVTEVDEGAQGDISIIIEDDVSKEETEIVLIYKEIRERKSKSILPAPYKDRNRLSSVRWGLN